MIHRGECYFLKIVKLVIPLILAHSHIATGSEHKEVIGWSPETWNGTCEKIQNMTKSIRLSCEDRKGFEKILIVHDKDKHAVLALEGSQITDYGMTFTFRYKVDKNTGELILDQFESGTVNVSVHCAYKSVHRRLMTSIKSISNVVPDNCTEVELPNKQWQPEIHVFGGGWYTLFVEAPKSVLPFILIEDRHYLYPNKAKKEIRGDPFHIIRELRNETPLRNISYRNYTTSHAWKYEIDFNLTLSIYTSKDNSSVTVQVKDQNGHVRQQTTLTVIPKPKFTGKMAINEQNESTIHGNQSIVVSSPILKDRAEPERFDVMVIDTWYIGGTKINDLLKQLRRHIDLTSNGQQLTIRSNKDSSFQSYVNEAQNVTKEICYWSRNTNGAKKREIECWRFSIRLPTYEMKDSHTSLSYNWRKIIIIVFVAIGLIVVQFVFVYLVRKYCCRRSSTPLSRGVSEEKFAMQLTPSEHQRGSDEGSDVVCDRQNDSDYLSRVVSV